MMNTAEILQSALFREFETTARNTGRQPSDVLSELLSEYIETEADLALDNVLTKSGPPMNYGEDDAVSIVRAFREGRL